MVIEHAARRQGGRQHPAARIREALAFVLRAGQKRAAPGEDNDLSRRRDGTGRACDVLRARRHPSGCRKEGRRGLVGIGMAE